MSICLRFSRNKKKVWKRRNENIFKCQINTDTELFILQYITSLYFIISFSVCILCLNRFNNNRFNRKNRLALTFNFCNQFENVVLDGCITYDSWLTPTNWLQGKFKVNVFLFYWEAFYRNNEKFRFNLISVRIVLSFCQWKSREKKKRKTK